MRTVVILVPIKCKETGRKHLEDIEDKVFISRADILNEFPENDWDKISIVSISDFMDLFNNDDIKQISYFIGYARIND